MGLPLPQRGQRPAAVSPEAKWSPNGDKRRVRPGAAGDQHLGERKWGERTLPRGRATTGRASFAGGEMRPEWDKGPGFCRWDPAQQSRDGDNKYWCGVTKSWPADNRSKAWFRAAKCRKRFCGAFATLKNWASNRTRGFAAGESVDRTGQKGRKAGTEAACGKNVGPISFAGPPTFPRCLHFLSQMTVGKK